MIVLVHWNDAWGNTTGYYDPAHTYKPIPMVTVGYLVKETEHGILTATDYQSGELYRGESFVPWEMVTKVEVLDYE